jgi:hypothetical protein
LNPAQFAAALPAVRGFSVLSHGPAGGSPAAQWSSAAEPVLDAARQCFEVTVVDLGGRPESGPFPVASCDAVVLVVPARLRAVAAAAAVLPRLAPAPVRILLRGPVYNGLDPYRVGGALDIHEPALLPHLRGIPAAEAQGRLLERGRQRLPRRLCRSLLDEFSRGFPGGSPGGSPGGRAAA